MKEYNIDHKLLDNAKKVSTGVSSIWNDFKAFINKGSVVEVAVGLILASSFSAVVNSFVDDILSPIIGLIAANNLNNAYIPIKCPPNLNVSCSEIFIVTQTYPSLEAAHSVGIITWNYGKFFQEGFNFLIKSIMLYLIIKGFVAASSIRKKEKEAIERECLFCCKMIPLKASKCSFCCSVIDKSMGSQIHIE